MNIKEFLASAVAFWRSLSNSKRIALVLLTALVLAGVLIFPKIAGKGRLVPLYTRLAPADAAAIVESLDQQKIPYELSSAGATILVPEDRLYNLRLQMASEGLPKGASVGFELFDKSQFGATEFEQHISLRRAMEGELARSIETIDGVDAARVHLVMPRGSVFVSKQKRASASVVVRLRSPGVFGKKEVASVVHLVSAGVQGLARNQISVVSTDGTTLHRPSDSELGGIGSGILSDEAEEISTLLEAKARSQLERVVGPGGADIRVAVVLDHSTKEETKETFEPDRTSLRSEHETQEDTRTESPGMQGIPGARTNLPDNDGGEQTEVTPEKNLDTSKRTSRTRNWEVDRVLEKVHTPPGSVARLSIAVLLNGTWQKQEGGSDVFVPRPQEEVDQLTGIVKQAVGFSELRGDTIQVSAAKFIKGEEIESELSKAPVPWWRHPYAIFALIGLIVFAIFMVLILVWRSSRQKRLADKAALARLEELKDARATSKAAEQEEQDQEDASALPSGSRLKNLLNGGPEAIAELREEALQIAGKDPSTTAVVMRTWLEETNRNAPEGANQAAE